MIVARGIDLHLVEGTLKFGYDLMSLEQNKNCGATYCLRGI